MSRTEREGAERTEVERLEEVKAQIIASPNNERILAWTVGLFMIVASAFVLFTGWYAHQLDELINLKADELSRQLLACPR